MIIISKIHIGNSNRYQLDFELIKPYNIFGYIQSDYVGKYIKPKKRHGTTYESRFELMIYIFVTYKYEKEALKIRYR